MSAVSGANSKRETIVALFFSAMLVVSVQTILSLTSIDPAAMQIFRYGSRIGMAFLIPTSVELAIFYFITPMILCPVFSILFNPKRILSPFYVNAGAVAIFTVLVANKLIISYQTSYYTILNLIFSLIASGGLLLVASLGQTEVVKFIVGLDLFGTDRVTYLINGDYKTILNVLDADLLESWYFERKHDGIKSGRIYKRNPLYGESIVIVLEPDKELNNTILATVAYRQTYYEIKETEIEPQHKGIHSVTI